ncbi:hypothetical protein GCM10027600_01050 [Nocardioides ginsengisegetis]
MSAAARTLHLTQSAVSQQLSLLEREAGSPLLVRSTRGIDLTEAGVLLLSRADAVSSELHMATEELAYRRESARRKGAAHRVPFRSVQRGARSHPALASPG